MTNKKFATPMPSTSRFLHPAALRGAPVPSTFGSSSFATAQEITDLLMQPTGKQATPAIGHIVDTTSGTDKLRPLFPMAGAKLLMASPGSGKTTAIIVTSLLTCSCPAIVLDGKGESYHRAAGARKAKMGRNAILLTTDGPTHVFNPILTVRVDRSSSTGGRYEERDAENLARIAANTQPKGDNKIFENWQIAFAAGGILYVCTSDLLPDSKPRLASDPDIAIPRERSMAEVARLMMLDGVARKLLAARMQKSTRRLVREAGAMLADASIGDGKLAMNIAMFARDNWAIFGSPEVRAMTYRAASSEPGAEPAPNDIDFSTFRGGSDDIYIVFPLIDTTRYSSVLRVFIGSIVDNLARFPGQKSDPFVNIHCDEFPQLKTLDPMQDWILFLRGYRIAPWFYVQDPASLKRHYPESWSTFEAVATKVFFGVNDIETAKHASEYLGTTTVENRSYSVSGSETWQDGDFWSKQSGWFSGRSTGSHAEETPNGASEGTSESVNDGTNSADSWGENHSRGGSAGFTETLAYVGRSLMTPQEIMAMGRHEMLLLARGHKPVRGYLLPYYEFPELRKLAEIPPPVRLPFADFLD